MGRNDIASGAGFCVSLEASNAGGVAAGGGEVLLGGGLVRHAAAEQLTHGAGDARGARVAARQPASLLIVRLQQQQASCVCAPRPPLHTRYNTYYDYKPRDFMDNLI